MPRFKLKAGMFVLLTRALPLESVWIVGWSWSYEDLWYYWIDNPDREWDLGVVMSIVAHSSEGVVERLEVRRIEKPIPPHRYAARLAQRAKRKV